MSAKELYWSVDVETDGPIPGPYSMLSFGAVAITHDGDVMAEASYNLELLPDAGSHPDTVKFWEGHPAAYAATRTDLVTPEAAMAGFSATIKKQQDRDGRRPVFVAYPAGFDFMFMYWYMIKFLGWSPFSFSALDMKTLAMVRLGKGYRNATKRNFPKRWFSGLPHTHLAIDDAREQAFMFAAMLNDTDSKETPDPRA